MKRVDERIESAADLDLRRRAELARSEAQRLAHERQEEQRRRGTRPVVERTSDGNRRQDARRRSRESGRRRLVNRPRRMPRAVASKSVSRQSSNGATRTSERAGASWTGWLDSAEQTLSGGRPDEAASWLKQAETIQLIGGDTELARRLEAARTELTRQREKLAVHERELLEQQARDAQAERVAERARKLFAIGKHDQALALLRGAHEHTTIRGVIEELESQLVRFERQRERQERADRSRERRAAAALATAEGCR